MRSDGDYLKDILGAIGNVERYRSAGRDRFEADELLQTFMVHQLLIIGEAANHVSQACRERAPEIEWPVIVSMRNRLIHGYFTINKAEVWKAVEDDLPKLKGDVERLLSKTWPSQAPRECHPHTTSAADELLAVSQPKTVPQARADLSFCVRLRPFG